MGWRRQGFLVEALEGERLESFRKQGWMACLILSGLSVGGETADSSAALRFGQDDKFVALVGSSGWLWERAEDIGQKALSRSGGNGVAGILRLRSG